MCVQVPDGPLHLWLYQTESLVDSLDEGLIASTFRIQDDSTVPQRDDSVSDFFYGERSSSMPAPVARVQGMLQAPVADHSKILWHISVTEHH
jgi:hypothetical protein